jgi:hypothetical protein
MVAASPPWHCPSPAGPKFETLEPHTTLWRIHSPLFGGSDFNPYGVEEKMANAPKYGAPGRFDSIPHDYAYLYAGATRKVTLAEAFIRNASANPATRFVLYASLRDALLTKLIVKNRLRLAVLHGDGLSRVGQDAWLTSCDEGEYGRTQEWAAAIRRWAPDAQGFVWRSKQANDGMAYVFFGDRGAQDSFTISGDQQLGFGGGLSIATRLLAEMGIAVDSSAALRPRGLALPVTPS